MHWTRSPVKGENRQLSQFQRFCSSGDWPVFNSLRIYGCLILLTSLVTAADKSQKVSSDTLQNDQLAVSGRYDRFERLLSQMADILGREEPHRVELLRRAISKGREKAISIQLGQIADDLSQDNLGKALELQEEVLESLADLLRLLQSEDRRSELEKERERLNSLLKDVSNTLSEQKSARASTQNSSAPSSSAPNQQKAIERATKILDEIKAHDGQAENAADGESTDTDDEKSSNRSGDDSDTQPGKSAESSSSDNDQSKPDAESNKSDTEAGESKSKGSQSRNPDADETPQQHSKDGSFGQHSQSGRKKSKSQNSQSPQQNGESESRQTPGKDQVFRARQMMQESLEQLQKQLRDKALEKQDGVIEELQKAVEELQKKLLQLREEEKELILASLEARFQRMLSMQIQIYDDTVDLNTTPVDDWLDTMFARSREVAQQQAELQVLCEQTMGLLKEDGTSVAIVLSVEDIFTDMHTIASRLRESKVGTLTQSLETDIIEALKELIEATQREMQDMKSEEHQQQTQSGEQKEPPLVQLMAEIKILRSLQLRVNRRTQRIDRLMAEHPETDLISQLKELTSRQQRLAESTEELAERISR